VGGGGGPGDRIVAELAAPQRRGGLGDLLGPARDAAEHNSGLDDPSRFPIPVSRLPLHPRRDAQHGEVERAASPQLVIDRVPAVGCREADLVEDIVRLMGWDVVAVVVILAVVRTQYLS